MVGEMTENDKEVYQKGVALLEEWEDVNYCEHDFKFKDEWLTDKEVVDLLDEQHETIQHLETVYKGNKQLLDKQDKTIRALYTQCKIFKEMLDDMCVPYLIDERLEKFFEEGVDLE
jgi:hypothetical protein